MPNVISRKNTISIEYELNDLEVAIMEILNRYPSTVHQIISILKFQGLEDVTPMQIARRLNDLCVMGLAHKEKKNARVLIYSIQEQE